MANRHNSVVPANPPRISLDSLQEEASRRRRSKSRSGRGGRDNSLPDYSRATAAPPIQFPVDNSYRPSFGEGRANQRFSDSEALEEGDRLTTKNPKLESSFDLRRIGNNFHIRESDSTSMSQRKRSLLGFSQGPITTTLHGNITGRRGHTAGRNSGATSSLLHSQKHVQFSGKFNSTSGSIDRVLSMPRTSTPGTQLIKTTKIRQTPTSDLENQSFSHNTVEERRLSTTSSAPMNTLSFDNWFNNLPDDMAPSDAPGAILPCPSPSSPSVISISSSNSKNFSNKLELQEMDDSDMESGCIYGNHKHLGRISKGEPIDVETATNIKILMLGSTNRQFSDAWRSQAFTFNSRPGLGFGLVQQKGGPCGVLATIQANIVLNLCQGNSYFGLDKAKRPLEPSTEERNMALAASLADIIANTAINQTSFTVAISVPKKFLHSAGKFRTDGVTEFLTLHKFPDRNRLFEFVKENLGYFTGTGNSSVMALLYSAVLTRSVEQVKKDMDSPDSSLMGAHDYCSQEMVNLLLTGKAVSNVFDGEIILGEGADKTVLKGIQDDNRIGLLSLFEHYKSCEVGSHLKCPLLPIWVVCSESHFTVVFSVTESLQDQEMFDLYYYDGLSKQETIIRLSIHFIPEETFAADTKTDLIPPLEHCLRTKWRGAVINWNGSEPIL